MLRPWLAGLGHGGAVMPRSCDHAMQPGEEPCLLDSFVVVPDKSKYVDQQTLKLQENLEAKGCSSHDVYWLVKRSDPNLAILMEDDEVQVKKIKLQETLGIEYVQCNASPVKVQVPWRSTAIV